MMSVLMLLAGIALGVTVLNPRRRGPDGAKYPKPAKNIRVSVSYSVTGPDSGVNIVVDPMVAAVGEGEEITWEFDSSAPADLLRIVPKKVDDWPLSGPLPLSEGSVTKPKIMGGKVVRKKRDDPYSYDVVVKVNTGPDNSGTWIRIDPELVIAWD
jgi:hypothetical protein